MFWACRCPFSKHSKKQNIERNIMQEEWRDVVGCEGCYEVSNLGRVRGVARTLKDGRCWKPRVMKLIKHPAGYLQIRLSSANGIKNTYKVHRLVAMAFIPNPNNLPQIDHIDGNRANNTAENLRWCTAGENSNNPITRSRMSCSAHISKIGKFGKLNNATKPVVCIETGILYWGTHEVNRKLGIDGSHVTSVCKGKQKTCGGYHWRYATIEEIEIVN